MPRSHTSVICGSIRLASAASSRSRWLLPAPSLPSTTVTRLAPNAPTRNESTFRCQHHTTVSSASIQHHHCQHRHRQHHHCRHHHCRQCVIQHHHCQHHHSASTHASTSPSVYAQDQIKACGALESTRQILDRSSVLPGAHPWLRGLGAIWILSQGDSRRCSGLLVAERGLRVVLEPFLSPEQRGQVRAFRGLSQWTTDSQ